MMLLYGDQEAGCDNSKPWSMDIIMDSYNASTNNVPYLYGHRHACITNTIATYANCAVLMTAIVITTLTVTRYKQSGDLIHIPIIPSVLLSMSVGSYIGVFAVITILLFVKDAILDTYIALLINSVTQVIVVCYILLFTGVVLLLPLYV